MIKAVLFDLDGTLFDRDTSVKCMFVGDHPLVDVAGARAAGLTAVWKRDVYWEPPTGADAVIDELHELAAWMQRY
jgi:putative hydrolase of the HAD superfamily